MTKTQPKTRRAGANDLSDQRKAELWARAEALAAEYSARLPEGDAGLIEAERRLQEYRPRETSLYREFNIGFEAERDIIIPTIRSAQNALIDHIEQTAPQTMLGLPSSCGGSVMKTPEWQPARTHKRWAGPGCR